VSLARLPALQTSDRWKNELLEQFEVRHIGARGARATTEPARSIGAPTAGTCAEGLSESVAALAKHGELRRHRRQSFAESSSDFLAAFRACRLDVSVSRLWLVVDRLACSGARAHHVRRQQSQSRIAFGKTRQQFLGDFGARHPFVAGQRRKKRSD
jgi:hypothetical protein